MKYKNMIPITMLIFFVFAGLILAYHNIESKPTNVSSEKLVIRDASISSPEDIIKDYVLLSRLNKTVDLKSKITIMPDSYIEYRITNASKAFSTNQDRRGTITDENGNIFFESREDEINAVREVSQDNTFANVAETFPSFVREDKLVYEKMITEKLNSIDALVFVSLRSETHQAYVRKFYFFLHKDDHAWKIFLITDLELDKGFPTR